MGESFKEFCYKLKNYFNNKVYIKDINNNNPVDVAVREIKIENGFLYIDGERVKLPNAENTTIIIVNGSIEKIENCQNVFIAEDVHFAHNISNLICRDIENNFVADFVKVSGNVGGDVYAKCNIDINGNVSGDVKGRDVTIEGNLNGNVISKRDFTQKGDIGGDVYESFVRLSSNDLSYDDDIFDYLDYENDDNLESNDFFPF